MDHFEVTEALSTFQILVDNREQATPKAVERYKSFGVPYKRATLNYGDYCGMITVNGSDTYDTAKAVKRDRFRREMERATANGSVIYLLVENATYEGIINHRYKSRFNPSAFLASLTAWTVRYNLRPIFCKASTSGQVIKEILYRDMKERLERGEYG